MAISFKHKHTATGSEAGNGEVGKSEWNDEHDLTGTSGHVLGFDSGGDAKEVAILGTVSESSGVPTGAVIERGSNANGEYVKFADGTLIMTANVEVDTSSSVAVDFSYPATPAERPGVFLGGRAAVAQNNIWNYIAVGVETNWKVYGDGSGSDTNLPVTLNAIGRWF